MNKAEAKYESEVLFPSELQGQIIWHVYEGLTLKLGPDLRYTPDFIVQKVGGEIECHDVKPADKHGKPLIEDAGRVKMITAAEKFPFRFSSHWFDCTDKSWKEKVY